MKQSRAAEYDDRDCFAEFILGLAEGETRGLAITDAGLYGVAVQVLYSSGFTLPNFFTKATIDQMS
jgi:hypothetical protein